MCSQTNLSTRDTKLAQQSSLGYCLLPWDVSTIATVKGTLWKGGHRQHNLLSSFPEPCSGWAEVGKVVLSTVLCHILLPGPTNNAAWSQSNPLSCGSPFHRSTPHPQSLQATLKHIALSSKSCLPTGQCNNSGRQISFVKWPHLYGHRDRRPQKCSSNSSTLNNMYFLTHFGDFPQSPKLKQNFHSKDRKLLMTFKRTFPTGDFQTI